MRGGVIVIRVKGGFIEDIEGNPVPVRVYDYDASYDVENPDRDEHGRPCIVSAFQPEAARR